jgi:hypothetical protein
MVGRSRLRLHALHRETVGIGQVLSIAVHLAARRHRALDKSKSEAPQLTLPALERLDWSLGRSGSSIL